MKTKFTVLAFLLAFSASGALAADRYVSTAGSDVANNCLLVGSPCATIAHAISEADPGDTIVVAAGTYTEGTILINKDYLTVRGPNNAIHADGVTDGARGAEAIFTGATHEYIFGIQAHNITIEGFEIDTSGSTDTWAGIRIMTGGWDRWVIQNNLIHDIDDTKDAPASGVSNFSYGIYGDAQTTSGTLSMTGGTITGNYIHTLGMSTHLTGANVSSGVGIYLEGISGEDADCDWVNVFTCGVFIYDNLFEHLFTGQNQLFMGLGDGQFVETTDQAGITADVQTYGVAAADYDNDGDLDVFIGACAQDARRSVNLLFRNNGDGTFQEVGADAGINDNGNAWGVNWVDYDRDGLLDVHVANMRISFFDTRGNKNKLYRNKGDGTFEDVSAAAGVEGNDDSYGSSVADFNNDGWPDIWAANFGSPPTIWINNGDGTFVDSFASSGLTDFFGNLSVGVGDVNRDGWADVYSGADDPSGPQSRLLLNTPGINHWLTVRLIQEAPNLRGIGARIQVWTGGQRQIQEIVAGDGFVSQNHDLSAPFGLGLYAEADSIIVRWPDGQSDYWYGVGADREVTLRKGGTFDAPPTPFWALEHVLTKRSGGFEASVSW